MAQQKELPAEPGGEDEERERARRRPRPAYLSVHSSVESLHIDQDQYVSDVPSEDLDKLSTCLTEASVEPHEAKPTSVFSDVLQAQLALWTLIGSIFYTYAWQQHRKKFLISLFVVVPPLVLICCTISSLLTMIVFLSRFFSSPVRFEDMLKCKVEEESDFRHDRRRRSTSVNSSVSGRSISYEELPKPVCRKHSACHSSLGSLNQISASSPTSFYGNASLNGRCGGSNSHKLNYNFAHISGGSDEFAS